MKALIAVLCCTMAVGLAAVPPAVMQEFAAWAAAEGRTYATHQERMLRADYYYANWLQVRLLNAAETTATFELNKYADWSASELASLRGFNATQSRTAEGKKTAPMPGLAPPDSVDWRTKGVLTAIKDQKQCGSCWAFSATSNVETVDAVAGGSLTSLSEQDLVDCEHNCGSYRTMSGCDEGCNGGLQPNAWKYLMAHGQPTETSYPYRGSGGACQTGKPSVGKVTNWEFIAEDEVQMANYVATKHPFAVAVNAAQWSFYRGGIMSSASICPAGAALDHAVNVVGYGTEGTTPYWIIRNSWNANWGEQGYLRIIRGSNYCGVRDFACSAIA